MKTSAIKLATLLLFTLPFVACKKDKEKPFNEQLLGNWKSVEVIQDDKDITNNFKLTFNLEEDDEFSGQIKTIHPETGEVEISPISGEWEVNAEKKQFEITYDDGYTETYKVTELEDDKMVTELKGQDLTIEFEK